MFRVWKGIRNKVEYDLRQHFQWRRPFQLETKPETGRSSENLSDLKLSDRAKQVAERLISGYHFGEYRQQTSAGNFRENLFYLHMLDTAGYQGNIDLPETLTVYDIGTSHWFYAHALSAFLTYYHTSEGIRKIDVKGFDSDPYRMYADFHTRYDHAQKNCAGLDGFEFIPHGFELQQVRADLITLFFPFVFESDHLDWGLPRSKFSPDDLISSAWNNLKPGGTMVIVNQGEEEHKHQKEILARLGIPVDAAIKMDDALFQYDLNRYILVCKYQGKP